MPTMKTKEKRLVTPKSNVENKKRTTDFWLLEIKKGKRQKGLDIVRRKRESSKGMWLTLGLNTKGQGIAPRQKNKEFVMKSLFLSLAFFITMLVTACPTG